MQVFVKKEYQTLDKNNFNQVCDLVDRIVEDIWKTSKLEFDSEWQDELKMALVKDYMFDLINPALLDLDSSDS
jgi:5-methylthioribose kinase